MQEVDRKDNIIMSDFSKEEIQTISDIKDCFNYFGRNDFVLTDEDIYNLKSGLIINASIMGEYSFTLRFKPNEDKEKLITKWLLDNVFENEKYYELHDEDTLNDMIWDLMEIIASLHNEYYKAIRGQYYDYMFHWVNKMNAGSIIDDIFKEFK